MLWNFKILTDLFVLWASKIKENIRETMLNVSRSPVRLVFDSLIVHGVYCKFGRAVLLLSFVISRRDLYERVCLVERIYITTNLLIQYFIVLFFCDLMDYI